MGSAHFQKQRKALQEENRTLVRRALDAEAALLRQQEVVAELQHLLAVAECKVATPAKQPLVRSSTLLQTSLVDVDGSGLANVHNRQQQHQSAAADGRIITPAKPQCIHAICEFV